MEIHFDEDTPADLADDGHYCICRKSVDVIAQILVKLNESFSPVDLPVVAGSIVFELVGGGRAVLDHPMETMGEMITLVHLVAHAFDDIAKKHNRRIVSYVSHEDQVALVTEAYAHAQQALKDSGHKEIRGN
jgi:hypothetical protein